MPTDEELRSQGWEDADIAQYQRGWAEAESRAASASLPPPRPAPEKPVRYLPGEFRLGGHSDRGRWQSETPAGRLSALFPPPDEAAQLAEARALADSHEMTYGTRPPLGQCLAKIRHENPHSIMLTGTSAEVGAQFRSAGLSFAIVQQIQAPMSGGVVFGPGGGPQQHGDPGIAGQAHAYLTRPRTFT